MKYVILIRSNPQSREIWEAFTEAQRAEGWPPTPRSPRSSPRPAS